MSAFNFMRVVSLVTRLALVTTSFAAEADLIGNFGIDPDVSYRAMRHIESVDGTISFRETRAPRKVRMEMKMGNQEMVVISREDLGRSYTLLPATNMFISRDGTAQESQPEDFRITEATYLGPEVVNGIATRKYRGKFVLTSGGRGGGHYWVSGEGIAVKIDMLYAGEDRAGQRIVMHLSDLVVGPQDPAQFEVPAGYRAMPIAAPPSQAKPADNPLAAASGDIASETGNAAKQQVRDELQFEAKRQVRRAFNSLFRR